MTIGWDEIIPFPQTLKIGIDDVIMSSYGSYEFDGDTTVSAGFELWILGPPAHVCIEDKKVCILEIEPSFLRFVPNL